jgi:hypothetical protein
VIGWDAALVAGGEQCPSSRPPMTGRPLTDGIGTLGTPTAVAIIYWELESAAAHLVFK